MSRPVHTVASHPFFRRVKAPLHISHRGGAGLYPENTLLAFDAAVRLHRTDMLELDVHLSKDGEVIVAHDETVDRCTDGTGRVAELTCAELQRLDAGFHLTPAGASGFPFRGKGARIPRLAEVLAAYPALPMNVELKCHEVLGPLVSLLRAAGATDRLCLGSEHDDIAAALAEAMPEACLFYPRDALAAFILPVKAGEPPEDDVRYTVLDMPLQWEGTTLFDEALARAAAGLGKWINVWTVDDADDMRSALAQGVGGIMTDRPDVLRAVLDAQQPAAGHPR